MPRGGKRPGAGRKAGSVTTKTREIAEKATQEGLTPLEVMLSNMRHYHQLASDAEQLLEGITARELVGGPEMSEKDQMEVLLAHVRKAADLRQHAQSCARDAAPFIHARIAPVDSSKDAAKDQQFVPLAERLQAYAREAEIKNAGPKVVELKRK